MLDFNISETDVIDTIKYGKLEITHDGQHNDERKKYEKNNVAVITNYDSTIVITSYKNTPMVTAHAQKNMIDLGIDPAINYNNVIVGDGILLPHESGNRKLDKLKFSLDYKHDIITNNTKSIIIYVAKKSRDLDNERLDNERLDDEQPDDEETIYTINPNYLAFIKTNIIDTIVSLSDKLLDPLEQISVTYKIGSSSSHDFIIAKRAKRGTSNIVWYVDTNTEIGKIKLHDKLTKIQAHTHITDVLFKLTAIQANKINNPQKSNKQDDILIPFFTS